MSALESGSLEGAAFEDAADELGMLLSDVVNGGASVGFLGPLAASDAAAW